MNTATIYISALFLALSSTAQPANVLRDEHDSRQQLIVLKWPVDGEKLHLKIVPGIADDLH